MVYHRPCPQVVTAALDKPQNIAFKGVSDIVTDTDRLSEDAALQVLRESRPEDAILGEEGGVLGNPDAEYLWVVRSMLAACACVHPCTTAHFIHSSTACRWTLW